jgi:hypothetical protein
MDFIIYIRRLYPPVVILTDTDLVQGGASVSHRKFRKKFFFIFLKKGFYEYKHVSLLKCDKSTFRKYVALIHPLSKTMKIFELKVGKIDFY